MREPRMKIGIADWVRPETCVLLDEDGVMEYAGLIRDTPGREGATALLCAKDYARLMTMINLKKGAGVS